MYFLLRFSPHLSALLSFAVLFSLDRRSSWLRIIFGAWSLRDLIFIIISFLAFYFVVVLFLGAGHPLRSRLRFYPFLLLLWSSGLFTFYFLDQPLLLLFLVFLLPMVSWIWLESLYLFWQRPLAYQAYTLQRISSYLYLIILLLVTIALAGAQILLQIPFWAITLMAAILYFVIQTDYFLLHKLNDKSALVFSLFGTILSLEILLVLHLLPTHFFLYGFIIMLFFYVWFGIMKQTLSGPKGVKQPVWLYLTIGGLGAVIVFFTSLFLR